MSTRTPLGAAFGKIVREYRREMPQAALARFSGLQPERLAQLESGADEPTLQEVFVLATALDIRPSVLVEMTVDRARSERS